jgi:DNA-binding response OmpR family regulator
LANTHIDAIVLDLLIPEMHGFEFLRQLKTVRSSEQIPVFVVTAKDLTDEETRALRSGTEGLFLKGAGWEESLLAEIHNVVKVRRKTATAAANT